MGVIMGWFLGALGFILLSGMEIYWFFKSKEKEQQKIANGTYEMVYPHKRPKKQLNIGWSVFGVALILNMIIATITIIQPGQVGVVVDLFGSERGVEEKELTVGAHFIMPWKSLYLFPIYEQNVQWQNEEAFTFQTSEGLRVDADIGMTFNLLPTRIHELFCKYRRGMDEITSLFIHNNVRDAINKVSSKMVIEELYGPKKEQFFDEVLAIVRKDLEPLGFNISRLYIIGRFKLPENVMTALNLKIEATQRAQQRENELREAEAEAKKKIAAAEGDAKSIFIAAKAQSDANNLMTKSLSEELIQYEAIKKWNGVVPQVMGQGGMIFNLPLVKEDKQ